MIRSEKETGVVSSAKRASSMAHAAVGESNAAGRKEAGKQAGRQRAGQTFVERVSLSRPLLQVSRS